MLIKDAIDYFAAKRAKYLARLVRCKAKQNRLPEEEENLTKKIDATSLAIEALKKYSKQIPSRWTRIDPDGKETELEHCPVCFKRVDYVWEYCPECGQKIDWSYRYDE